MTQVIYELQTNLINAITENDTLPENLGELIYNALMKVKKETLKEVEAEVRKHIDNCFHFASYQI